MKTITIFGNVTKDAEVRRTQGGTEVCSFSVAVNDRRNNDATTFFDVSMWGTRGSKVAPYIRKGGQVCVAGELSTREYNGKTYLQVDCQSLTLGASKGKGGDQQKAQYDQSIGSKQDLDDEIPW